MASQRYAVAAFNVSIFIFSDETKTANQLSAVSAESKNNLLKEFWFVPFAERMPAKVQIGRRIFPKSRLLFFKIAFGVYEKKLRITAFLKRVSFCKTKTEHDLFRHVSTRIKTIKPYKEELKNGFSNLRRHFKKKTEARHRLSE